MNKLASHPLDARSAAAPPAWYRTPVATIPIAAAAFILGNVLMMIPWEGL